MKRLICRLIGHKPYRWWDDLPKDRTCHGTMTCTRCWAEGYVILDNVDGGRIVCKVWFRPGWSVNDFLDHFADMPETTG